MGNRRTFLKHAALTSAAVALQPWNRSLAFPEKTGKPIVLSTWNFGLRANAKAWETLAAGGRALDAVEAGVRVIESDPEERSVGLGAQVAGTTTNFNQGVFQTTNVPTDMAINGSGWFTVQSVGGTNYLTRNGAFVEDSSGYLRTSGGDFLMGVTGTTPPTSPTAGYPTQKIQIPTTVTSGSPVVSFAVDPTGAVRPQRVSLGAAAAADGQLPWYENGWLQSLRNRWDIVNRWWGQGVIGFDALRQRGLLTRFGIRYADTATLGVLLATSCVLFIAIGLAWALLRRRVRDPLRAALRELEHKLARRGIVRRHSEGPQHYLSRAARALPGQRGELALLMKCYLELRYAHDEPPPESLRDFQHAVRDFRVVRVVK